MGCVSSRPQAADGQQANEYAEPAPALASANAQKDPALHKETSKMSTETFGSESTPQAEADHHPFRDYADAKDEAFLLQKAVAHDLRKGAPHAPCEDCTGGGPTRMDTIRVLQHMDAESCPELNTLLAAICEVWKAPVSSVTLLNRTLLTPNPMTLAVGDLRADSRFNGNCHNTAGTQSYLTAPLVASNGHRLGAICFVDQQTRTFDAGDCRMMANFAEVAVREIEKHVNLAQRLRSGDLEEPLTRVYSTRVRDVEEVADTCVILVDTSVSGWRLVYASGGWEEWTGVPRAQCVGRTLNELLEHVHGDAHDDVVWQGPVHSAAQMQAFVLPKVRVRSSRASVLPFHSALNSFYLSFKPAALDTLDEDTVPIGVPAQFATKGVSVSASKYFFARLHTTPAPPVNSRVTSVAASTICPSPAMSWRQSCSNSRLITSPAYNVLHSAAARLEALSPVAAAAQLFRGLRVGQILGQGNFGTVWTAHWHSMNVALKVVDNDVADAEELERVLAEQVLGSQLMHLNIIRTLAYMSSYMDHTKHTHADARRAALGSGACACVSSGDATGTSSDEWDAITAGGLNRQSQGSALAQGSCGWDHGLGSGFSVVPWVAGENYVSDGSDMPLPKADGNLGTNTNTTGSYKALDRVSIEEIEIVPQELGTRTPRADITVANNTAVIPGLQQGGVGVCGAGGESKHVSGSTGFTFPTVKNGQQQGSPHCTNTLLQAVLINTAPGLTDFGHTSGGSESVSVGVGGLVGLQHSSAAGPVAEGTAESSSGSGAVVAGAAGSQEAAAAAAVLPAAVAIGTGVGQTGAGAGVGSAYAGPQYPAPLWHTIAVSESTGLDRLSSLGDPHHSTTHRRSRQPGQWQVESGPQAAALQAAGEALSRAARASRDHAQGLARESGSGAAASGAAAASGGGFASVCEEGVGDVCVSRDEPRRPREESDDLALRRYSSGGLMHKWQESEASLLPDTSSAVIPAFPLRLRQWTLMEFSDQGNLADAVDRGVLRTAPEPTAPPHMARVCATALDVSQGLRYLHSKKVVHGDLTAFNVLLSSIPVNPTLPQDRRGWIGKLSDFGLSKKIPDAQQAVKSATYGSITHMAPEVLSHEQVGYKGDVYSAGVIMWQMYTGSRPWAGLSHIQVSVAVGVDHLSLQWPPAHTPLEQRYQQLGQRCMARAPDDRPTAEELTGELMTLCQEACV